MSGNSVSRAAPPALERRLNYAGRRMIAGFDGSMMLLELASAAWVAAFGGFVLVYGPTLLRQRPVWAGRA